MLKLVKVDSSYPKVLEAAAICDERMKLPLDHHKNYTHCDARSHYFIFLLTSANFKLTHARSARTEGKLT